MEVFKDHRAAESVQPSIIGGMKTAGRFAVLGLALTLGGHETKPPHIPAARPDSMLDYCNGCDDPSELAPGTSLIGRRLRIQTADTREIIVRIIRVGGEVQLDVDGKRYGIKGIPGVNVGQAIDAVKMGDGDVTVDAPEYGIARVTRAEIERVLRTLADAESSSVTAEVETRLSVKHGTLLAATLGLSRMLSGWHEGDPERFDVGFVRERGHTALASLER